MYGRGTALKTLTSSETFETTLYGSVPSVQTAATYNENDGSITVFALQCDVQEDAEFSIDLRSFGNVKMVEHLIMDGPDLLAKNTFEAPETVIPRKVAVDEANGGNIFKTTLSKLSWNVYRFARR